MDLDCGVAAPGLCDDWPAVKEEGGKQLSARAVASLGQRVRCGSGGAAAAAARHGKRALGVGSAARRAGALGVRASCGAPAVRGCVGTSLTTSVTGANQRVNF